MLLIMGGCWIACCLGNIVGYELTQHRGWTYVVQRSLQDGMTLAIATGMLWWFQC
jgi:hypothetical protein